MLRFGQKVIALILTYRAIRLLGVLYNDDLEPLELTDQAGWQVALDVLHGNGYQIALVVIRPEMQVHLEFFRFLVKWELKSCPSTF
jgi:hypothetical protein